MPTVYVIEDGPDERVALESMFRSAGLRVQCFESAESFLDTFDPDSADSAGCVVVDVQLPGKSGMELLHELRLRSRIPVIVVTGYAEVADSVQAMRIGAIDFIEKPYRAEHLLDQVHRGLKHHEAIRIIERRLSSLTAREREVMEMLATGKTAVQVADELGLSRKTVDVHRSRILSKAAVSNVVELVSLLHQLDS